MYEEDAAFDSWCPVCERSISPSDPLTSTTDQPSIASNTVPSPIIPPALSQSSKSTKSTKRLSSLATGNGNGNGKSNALGSRRKSTTKLHTTKHSKSTSNLHGLAPSTAIHPIVPTTVAATEEIQKPVVVESLIPPSSLYCSEECKRIDEMRSRLAFAHLVPSSSNNNHSKVSQGNGNGNVDSRRYSESNESSEGQFRTSRAYSNTSYSQQSQASGSSYGNSHLTRRTSTSSNYPSSASYAYPNDSTTSLPFNSVPPLLASSTGGSAMLPTLDFSTRRNSRGSNTEGSYPYFRDGLSMSSASASGRRSTDSLTSLSNAGDSDYERSNGNNGHTSSSFRPPSALSSLRFMTPILTPSTQNQSSSSNGTRRPPHLSRHHTDVPKLSDRSSSKDPPLPSPKRFGTESEPERNSSSQMNRTTSNSSSHSHSSPPPITSSSTFAQSQAQQMKKPHRTASSASLALMSSSIGKNYSASFDSRPTWTGPKRSDSTASLSGLVAVGTIIGGSELATLEQSTTTPTTDFRINSNGGGGGGGRGGRKNGRSIISNDSRDEREGSRSPDYSNSPGSSFNTSPPHYSTGNSTRGGRKFSGGNGNGLRMTPSSSSLVSSTNSTKSYHDYGEYKVGSGSGEGKRKESKSDRTPTQSSSTSKGLGSGNARSFSNLEGILQVGVGEWNGITGIVPSTTSKFDGNGNNGTIKKRSKESRTMSTPSTARRPNFLSLAPSSPKSPTSPTSPSSDSTTSTILPPPPPLSPRTKTINTNPKLSHLLNTEENQFSNKSRNWSWDHLHIPTYPALDLEKVRREKFEKEHGGDAVATLPPVVVKERKRLFYFSEGVDHE